MVDAAYYRRQAAVCRALASDSTRTERHLLDLADHFERRAANLEALSARNKSAASTRVGSSRAV